MKPNRSHLAVAVLLLFTVSCGSMKTLESTRTPNNERSAEEDDSFFGGASPDQKTVAQLLADYEKRKVQVFKKNNSIPSPDAKKMEVLARYIDFLKLPESEKSVVQARLFESSIQFLFCSPDDWACLQSASPITPLAPHRLDTEPGLGAPVKVNSPLKIDYFFTEQWYRTRKNVNTEQNVKIRDHAGIAGELEKVINKNWQRVSMAIYGIDGIGEIDKQTKQPNNSMLGVFNAIKSQPNIRAVVDVEAYKNVTESRKPEISYQYPPTAQLYDFMNQGSDPDRMKLRIEWPTANIMHNKFFVFEDRDEKSVWTGTANISKNCMGDEDFANLSVYIKNKEVADAYLKEFDEMFNYIPANEVKAPIKIGRFHQNKRPNTRRYFVFSDKTELTLHFSPTDDGEHRAILPLLYSAGEGDVIRISMFGSGGSGGAEYVRAIQYAAAKGADVMVFVDRDTSFQISNSWINRKAAVRLQEKNPYGPVKGRLQIKHSDWGMGNMDHHKTATLTRKTSRGMVPQVLVVGSQNWSVAGNDENDENMIVLKNSSQGLQIAKDYNEHFDKLLWPTGKTVEFEAGK